MRRGTDVYKRQAFKRERHGGERDFGMLLNDFITIVAVNKGITPVSYTHLDVYKRQVKHRDTFKVSEPGVGSGRDRGKIVPKSGMEDGEKSCVYFCGCLLYTSRCAMI